VLLGVFWTYTLLRVPETKGKTIEEISAAFKTSRGANHTRDGYQRLSYDDESEQ